MYGLRKVKADLKHYDFIWDLTIGAVNTCSDWNPEAKCGGGLHMLPEAQGDYDLLEGDYWVVVEFDESKMVKIDDQKAKVESCTVVHSSKATKTTKELLKFFKDVKFNSESAYGWASLIRDKKYMKQFITESHWARRWASLLGDVEHMKQFITEEQDAFNWARDIGDREEMKQLITNDYAFYWARDIGDREEMKQLINNQQQAYWWARDIGDREEMKQFITAAQYAYYWALYIGDREEMKQFITSDSTYASYWARNVENLPVITDPTYSDAWYTKRDNPVYRLHIS